MIHSLCVCVMQRCLWNYLVMTYYWTRGKTFAKNASIPITKSSKWRWKSRLKLKINKEIALVNTGEWKPIRISFGGGGHSHHFCLLMGDKSVKHWAILSWIHAHPPLPSAFVANENAPTLWSQPLIYIYLQASIFYPLIEVAFCFDQLAYSRNKPILPQ